VNYAVVIAPEALNDLDQLPSRVRQEVEYGIRRLATDPVRLSKPSTFPYVPAQCYRIKGSHGRSAFFITVLFRYSRDETAIEIFAIASSEVGTSDS
jgi:mRNA-degrading endonuclease RelE of RelBE toxin-antitoxin system